MTEERKTEYYLADISELIPYARNARTHSEEQVAQIAASIKEFGFLAPVIVSEDNTILCGHGRVLASQKLGLTKIPCIKEKYLTEAQKRAYIIADNKLSLNAGWDNDLLAIEISDLQGQDFDVSLLGFDDKELDKILSGDGSDAQDDDFDVEAELEKPAFSKTGDLWSLGKHKVICGDSTLPDVYKTLLGETKVNLVCTDAPYFVNLESSSGKIKNDDLDDKQAYEFLMSVYKNVHDAMAKDASIYEFYATSKARVFHDAFEDSGFKVGAGLVWKKDRLVLTRTDWKYIHEPIIFGWRKDGKHEWYGDQKQTTVFEFDRIKSSKEDGCGHPSSKPIPLIGYLVGLSSMTNSLVLDVFLGSASTLMACDQMNRVCYGIEIEPKYVDVAVERYLSAHPGEEETVTVLRDGKTLTYREVKEAA